MTTTTAAARPLGLVQIMNQAGKALAAHTVSHIHDGQPCHDTDTITHPSLPGIRATTTPLLPLLVQTCDGVLWRYLRGSDYIGVTEPLRNKWDSLDGLANMGVTLAVYP